MTRINIIDSEIKDWEKNGKSGEYTLITLSDNKKFSLIGDLADAYTGEGWYDAAIIESPYINKKGDQIMGEKIIKLVRISKENEIQEPDGHTLVHNPNDIPTQRDLTTNIKYQNDSITSQVCVKAASEIYIALVTAKISNYLEVSDIVKSLILAAKTVHENSTQTVHNDLK